MATTTAVQVKSQAKEAAHDAKKATQNPLFQRLAQLGYVARGLVYGIIGVLALEVALGIGGATTDQTGALAILGSEPYVTFLLLIVAIGLAGYALWGFVRAIFDPLHRGHDLKGIAARIGYASSGFSYSVFFIIIVLYLMGQRSGAGQQTAKTQDLTAKVLTMPFGQWLVIAFGLIWLGIAVAQFYVAFKTDFAKDFKARSMTGLEKKWAKILGQIGITARGIVFALIGIFVLRAALTFNPAEAVGFDGALDKLLQQPYGHLWLGLVAIGLVIFGIFSALCARWERIPSK